MVVALLAGTTTVPTSAAPAAGPRVIRSAPGITAFISKVTIGELTPSSLKRISFTVAPKPGSTTTPISAWYTKEYLASHGYIRNDKITVPVFGLYAGRTNNVTFRYESNSGNGSFRTSITTAHDVLADSYARHETLVPRDKTVHLDYSYFLLKAYGPRRYPLVMDTDGEVRWVGAGLPRSSASGFWHNGFYGAAPTGVTRMELDGTMSKISDLRPQGYIAFHHNIDSTDDGLFLQTLDANTDLFDVGSTIVEINAAGELVHSWNLAEIISNAMRAGGDLAADFVYRGDDWFHSNSVAYWKATNTLVVSSRENFVIGIDYTTQKIRWILGDPAKQWHTFPSLRKYALTLTGHAPIGQHSVSITPHGSLLLFDNGRHSDMHYPAGPNRTFSAAREYRIDPRAMTAREVWSYDHDRTVYSPICSSVYTMGSSTLIDYATENRTSVRLLGLDARGRTAFEYRWKGVTPSAGWNAEPIILNGLSFS